jgi:hypothetical protein
MDVVLSPDDLAVFVNTKEVAISFNDQKSPLYFSCVIPSERGPSADPWSFQRTVCSAFGLLAGTAVLLEKLPADGGGASHRLYIDFAGPIDPGFYRLSVLVPSKSPEHFVVTWFCCQQFLFLKFCNCVSSV